MEGNAPNGFCSKIIVARLFQLFRLYFCCWILYPISLSILLFLARRVFVWVWVSVCARNGGIMHVSNNVFLSNEFHNTSSHQRTIIIIIFKVRRMLCLCLQFCLFSFQCLKIVRRSSLHVRHLIIYFVLVYYSLFFAGCTKNLKSHKIIFTNFITPK